jgi:hypothetical protein
MIFLNWQRDALYSVVSYGAGLRLREFAIRTALGAQPGEVRRLYWPTRYGSG